MPKRRRDQDSDGDDGDDDGGDGARYNDDGDDADGGSHRTKRAKLDDAELAARRHEKEEQRKERRRQRLEEKRAQQKRDKRAAKEKKKGKSQPQRTLENTREFDETIVESNDFEVVEDEQVDQLANHLVDAARIPKILITTTPKPTRDCLDFVSELLDVFVGAQYLPRRNYQIKKMVTFCKNREFTHIILINEFKHKMHSATIICLPDGPTAHFRLSSTKVRKKIKNADLPTTHLPELVLNNFNTRLGHTVGRIFQSLFPQMAEFKGRRVATFHNQRDFIFFRHHRYIFESGKAARIQELGPQFTLKLKWLQRGTFDTAQGEYEWIHRREMDTSRRRFFL